MKTLHLSLAERSYPILIGEGLLGNGLAELSALAQGRQVAIVSNAAVFALYGAALTATLLSPDQSAQPALIKKVVLPDGEAYKTFESLNLVFDALLADHFDRRCLIIALGGGVIGDMAGFAAAVYQRGVDFVQIPTTLLAQVDSSVGGKTAINHSLGKNMIGSFHQPKLVIADVGTLKSLPVREVSAGLAEMFKHGAIADPQYFQSLLNNLDALRQCQGDLMMSAVLRSCEIKADVVSQDEREGGVRAILNFVAVGMVMAADLSARLGLVGDEVPALLRHANLAAGLPVAGPAWSPERYVELMAGDKKSDQGVPKFVLLAPFGQAIVRKVPMDALRQTLQACVE
jgi:3-dehydroquinate synthase